MSIDATLVCDCCGSIIHAARTSAKARREAKDQCGYERMRGSDWCFLCLEIHYPERPHGGEPVEVITGAVGGQ